MNNVDSGWFFHIEVLTGEILLSILVSSRTQRREESITDEEYK
jgi:hypothetical protein